MAVFDVFFENLLKLLFKMTAFSSNIRLKIKKKICIYMQSVLYKSVFTTDEREKLSVSIIQLQRDLKELRNRRNISRKSAKLSL